MIFAFHRSSSTPSYDALASMALYARFELHYVVTRHIASASMAWAAPYGCHCLRYYTLGSWPVGPQGGMFGLHRIYSKCYVIF